jgi:hypothetical protein
MFSLNHSQFNQTKLDGFSRSSLIHESSFACIYSNYQGKSSEFLSHFAKQGQYRKKSYEVILISELMNFFSENKCDMIHDQPCITTHVGLKKAMFSILLRFRET